jgi:hypothetical protein
MTKKVLSLAFLALSLAASADEPLPMPHPDDGRNFVCYAKGVLGHDRYAGKANEKRVAKEKALDACYLVRHRCRIISCHVERQ